MQRIQQVIYILLYLQFFVCNVFTFNINIWKKKTDVMCTNEWKCVSNDDCTAKNSECINNLCQCASGYIFNTDMTACVKVATNIYETCEDTVQCSAYLLNGAKCVKNVCVCGPGYYYLHGRCNQYVGLFEKCKRDVDCYVNADFEASTCNEGICNCRSGFYQREYRTCRREGKAEGDECTVDIDCTFGNATCNEFVCAIKSEVDEIVEFSSDITLTKRIWDKETRVGDICTADKDCKAVKNSECGPTGTCRCARAYFASTTKTECIPELGEPCPTDASHIEKSICREGRWSCTKGTVASKDNRKCLDVTRKYKGNCQVDEQCYIFGPDAMCNNNKCTCNEDTSHYVESELFCWGNTGIGKTCKQDRDCYVKDFNGNLTCSKDKCSCPDGTRLSKDKKSCIGPRGLGEACEKPIDCATPHSVCKKKVCICDKNYYESIHKTCNAGIDAVCENDEDCAPGNSKCISKKCTCRPGYVATSNNSCIPESLFGKPCFEDIQCSAVTAGSICEELPTSKGNKACTCKKEDQYKFKRCFPKKLIGETCTNWGECYETYNENRIVCKNGKCACNWGYKEFNGSICIDHPQKSKFFLSGSAVNVRSTGFFLIVLSFILSSKLI
ncbi:multiple epidermal growth factor-like domains protein 10 [Solenopsis invicta]|uniref:multiple epidermal growth factor-like domains protein 10 n=1 Tax=Solenopsis invicta TaxID=13686 RepID=UPI00193DB781|nr:multiple epidermal growth factor-like domains protein 10 [Solenopsis invicta]